MYEGYMVKRLTKHGNSLALIIDKPILDLLKITDKTELEIAVENGELIIRPTKKKRTKAQTEAKTATAEQMRKLTKKITSEYAEVFRKLADS